MKHIMHNTELGYGDRGSPPKIPGGSVLIFTMEILEIQGDKKPAMTCSLTLEIGSLKDSTGCNDKEKGYLEKIKDWEQSKYNNELTRLEKMKSNGQMKPELMAWLERRAHILKQFGAGSAAEEELWAKPTHFENLQLACSCDVDGGGSTVLRFYSLQYGVAEEAFEKVYQSYIL